MFAIRRYHEARKYLESLIPDEMNKRKGHLRLERISHLLSLLGNPEKTFKAIHVGGTSGKGSTAFLLSSLLSAAGYRVGLHLSPHLQVITERMQVNNRFISASRFCDLIESIKPFIERVDKEGSFGKPSYFEALVALSFQYFAMQKVDLAVIEVGLGGTLDATNVISPLVAIITNVDLDHTEILGDTVEEIAQDKAGIIKEGVKVVSGASQPSVISIIQKRCEEKQAPLMLLGKEVLIKEENSSSLFSIVTPKKEYRNLSLSFYGAHQKKNAALALGALEYLEEFGFFVSDEVICSTFAYLQFAGRIEIARRDPLLIFDGAHNAAKMKALVSALKAGFPKKRFTIIVGFKKGKDARSMLRILLPLSKKFVFTRFHSMTDTGKDISQDPQALTHIIDEIGQETVPREIQEEIAAFPQGDVLVTGSLYLVGELRNRFYPWEKILKARTSFPAVD